MPKVSKKKIEEFIRVDHAGERGAVKIYEGQLLALNTFVKDENLKKIIEEMKGFSKYYYFEVPKEKTENKEFWHEHINCFTMESFSNLLSKHFKIIAKKEDKFLHVLCENIR